PPDNDRDLQLVVQFVRLRRLTDRRVRPDNARRVGEVEGGRVVPFGNHVQSAPLPCVAHMLLEGIEVPERSRLHRGQQDHFHIGLNPIAGVGMRTQPLQFFDDTRQTPLPFEPIKINQILHTRPYQIHVQLDTKLFDLFQMRQMVQLNEAETERPAADKNVEPGIYIEAFKARQFHKISFQSIPSENNDHPAKDEDRPSENKDHPAVDENHPYTSAT